MPLTSIVKRFFYVAALWVVAAHLGNASVQAADANIVVDKKDGKFSGAISGQPNYPGLVGNVELRFVWSGMFKQPTEYYQFIWHHSGSVNYAGTTYIRSRFDKYPDLQRRFDQLKPLNVKLSMLVEFGDGINTFCAQGYDSGTGCITSFSKTVTSIPHLMVVRSGKVGDNITPSSPVDNWLGFFETGALSGSPEEINNKLLDMMRRADNIRVRNLRVVSYTAPHNQISALIEEYHRREEEEAEKEAEREEAENDAGEDDEESIFDKIKDFFSAGDDEEEEDDFWSGGSDKEPDDAGSGDDDEFWSGGKDKDDRSGTAKKDDFWNGGKDKGSGDTKKGDFWSGGKDGEGASSDVKKVSVGTGISGVEKVGCGNRSIRYSVVQEGYQDARGNWLVPPKKRVVTHREREAYLVIRKEGQRTPTLAQQKAATKRCLQRAYAKEREIKARYR